MGLARDGRVACFSRVMYIYFRDRLHLFWGSPAMIHLCLTSITRPPPNESRNNCSAAQIVCSVFHPFCQSRQPTLALVLIRGAPVIRALILVAACS